MTTLNQKQRSKAKTTPQKNALDCLPYWWRNTDKLNPVVMKPIAWDEASNILTFDLFNNETGMACGFKEKIFLGDETGKNIYTDLPATVSAWIEEYKKTQDTTTWCLAFFTDEYVAKFPSTVIMRGLGEGKWPRTAGLVDSATLLKILDDVAGGKLPLGKDLEFLKKVQELLRSR